MPLGMELGLSPGYFVLDGDPAPSLKRGRRPRLSPMSIVTKGLDGSRWHLAWRLGLSPGDYVLDGDPAPPKKGAEPPPQFSANFNCAQTAGCIKMPLGMEVGLSPEDFVFDRDPALPPQKRGRSTLPNFRPMSIVTKRLDGSRWYLALRWGLVQATVS